MIGRYPPPLDKDAVKAILIADGLAVLLIMIVLTLVYLCT
jgi:hypothetical protein